MQRRVTDEEFLAAARDGNLVVVCEYHDQNLLNPSVFSEVRDPDNHQMTGLMLAAWNGHVEVVAELLCIVNAKEEMPLVAGIDPNERDSLGRTALMLAAASGRDAVVELLIGYRCVDITLVDQRGRTAQQHALDNGHLELFFTMSRWPEMDEPAIEVMPSYAEVLRDAEEDLQRHGLEINWDEDWGFGEMEMDIDDELWMLLNPDLPEDAGRAEYELFEAVRNNDRETIEQYVTEHRNMPALAVTLNTAAELARVTGNVDLATIISQLVEDLNRTNQERFAEISAADREVKYNPNESRLMSCKLSGEVPEKLCCPVTYAIMLDPVTVSTGITYERDILWKLMDEDEWCICPFTRARIDRDELNNQGNVCLLAYIENFIKAQENREYSWDAAELLTCPLSRELFVDPVTVACGLTFEREALKKWFAENNFPDELIWQGKYVIKFVETRNGSSVAIKSLVNLYREKLKEEALNEQGSAQAMEVSPRMDVEQVRAARLRMFDQQDASPGDRGSRHDGGESNPKKRT